MDKQKNDPVLKSKQYLVRALLAAGYDLYFYDQRIVSTFGDGIWALVPSGAHLGNFVVSSAKLEHLLGAVVKDRTVMDKVFEKDVDDELYHTVEENHTNEVSPSAHIAAKLAYLQGFHDASGFPPLVPEVLEPGAMVFRAIKESLTPTHCTTSATL